MSRHTSVGSRMVCLKGSAVSDSSQHIARFTMTCYRWDAGHRYRLKAAQIRRWINASQEVQTSASVIDRYQAGWEARLTPTLRVAQQRLEQDDMLGAMTVLLGVFADVRISTP